MKKMSNKKNTGKFILGATIGAAIGFLFAPKAGKETRKIVKNKADDLLAKAKEIDVKEVRDVIEEKVSNIMEEIKDLDKEKALKLAKEKAAVLKESTEELVKYTKKKATPVVQDAAEVLRIKAIEATKKVLEKLENNN